MDKTLLNTHLISRKSLVLDNYKKLGLTDLEGMIIVQIIRILESGISFVDIKLLEVPLSSPKANIESALVNLMEKNYIVYKTENKKTTIDIQNLLNEIVNIYNKRSSSEEGSKNDNLIQKVSKLIRRQLNNSEIAKIDDMLSKNQNEKIILNSINECIKFDSNFSITNIEKTLKELEDKNNKARNNLKTKTQSTSFNWLESNEEDTK